MNCPNCKKELSEKEVQGVMLHRCSTCNGFWFEQGEFAAVMEHEDQFLKWSDLDLWKQNKNHSLETRAELCPSCSQYLYEVKYKGHDIHPWVCLSCKGVWIRKTELQKIKDYLEEELDSQTLTDFIKHLGEVLSEKEMTKQFKDLKMVLKLINYRLFSKFSILDKLSRNVPKP